MDCLGGGLERSQPLDCVRQRALRHVLAPNPRVGQQLRRRHAFGRVRLEQACDQLPCSLPQESCSKPKSGWGHCLATLTQTTTPHLRDATPLLGAERVVGRQDGIKYILRAKSGCLAFECDLDVRRALTPLAKCRVVQMGGGQRA